MKQDGGELCVSRIVVMSGIRPAGRTIDQTARPRPQHGILYIPCGEVYIMPEGEPPLSVCSGELVILPRGVRYTLQYTAPETSFVLINLQLTTPDGAPGFLSEQIRVLAKDPSERPIAAIMHRLELCSASENSAAVYRRKELVCRLFSLILEEDASDAAGGEKYAKIAPGVLLLRETYLKNLPVSRFAEACCISVSSFRGLFTEQYGMSPVQYRNHLRIRRAAVLLNEGNCSTAEAAYAAGFENVGYFCRYYKKITGETPGESRRNMK